MRYLWAILAATLFSCGTSSTEKPREHYPARVDGTRLADTLLVSDSVPPAVGNPQPD